MAANTLSFSTHGQLAKMRALKREWRAASSEKHHRQRAHQRPDGIVETSQRAVCEGEGGGG
jgi:hypothetical protein